MANCSLQTRTTDLEEDSPYVMMSDRVLPHDQPEQLSQLALETVDSEEELNVDSPERGRCSRRLDKCRCKGQSKVHSDPNDHQLFHFPGTNEQNYQRLKEGNSKDAVVSFRELTYQFYKTTLNDAIEFNTTDLRKPGCTSRTSLKFHLPPLYEDQPQIKLTRSLEVASVHPTSTS
jgi:hypothetical protein